MQTINLDISAKGIIPLLYTKQGDVGRKFKAILTNGGVPYPVPAGAAISVWYSGAAGEGNYTDIGADSAVSVSGNEITVELITQMLANPGAGNLCIVINTADGDQLGTWNIPYMVEALPGMGSTAAHDYFTAFSQAVQNLPYPDATLSAAGKAADAAAVGAALAGKAPDGYGLGTEAVSFKEFNDADSAMVNGWYSFNENTEHKPDYMNYGVINVSTRLSQREHDGISVPVRYVIQDARDVYGTRAQRVLCAAKKGELYVVDQNWDARWRYENPRMVPGTEYLTMEQYNGAAVYKMLDSSGNLWWRPENEETWRPEYGEGGGSSGEAVQGPPGPKGDPGEDGEDGISCTHSWDGTVLTVTSASGTSSADLKGEKGEKGDTGEQGEPGKDAVLKDLELIASGETTEAVQKFVISKDNAGNDFTVRDFFYVCVIVPPAAQETQLRLWTDADDTVVYVNNGMNTTQTRTTKITGFYAGMDWEYIISNTLTNQMTGSVVMSALDPRQCNNAITEFTIGCMNAGHTLPAGTKYWICGRRA